MKEWAALQQANQTYENLRTEEVDQRIHKAGNIEVRFICQADAGQDPGD